MQPKFRKVPYTAEKSSFLIRNMVEPFFYNPYHYHPEFELTVIIRGTGTRYIGDNVERFKAGDLVLVGSNLAHLWKCDDKYYKGDTNLTVRAIVIQFSKDFLGQGFWSIKEMRRIKKLLLHSERGIKLKGPNKVHIKDRMVNMLNYDPVDQIACLLSILNTITKTDEQTLLASPGFTNINKFSDKDKVNKICTFVINNFQSEIRLEDAANIAHMTPQAFCRFFKKQTHKTFFSYLNEVRIGYACKLLLDNSLSISQIALESGYNTLSYFNRQFKKVMKQTPSQYKSNFEMNN